MEQTLVNNLIEVRIVVPRCAFGGRIISRRRRDDHFHVLITNISNNAVHIWKETCSEGCECISFEWMDSAGAKGLARKGPIDWTVNRVGFWKLSPRESFVWNVYCAKPEWIGFPEPPKRDYEVSMRAIFKSHPMDEDFKALLRNREVPDEKAEIWAGQNESPWDTYAFWD
jgi:hypothetical protein